MPHKLLFLTERSPRHQQSALKSAPESIAITFASHQDRARIIAELADSEFLISERAGQIDAALIAAAPKLRLIQRLGSLTFDIDRVSAQRVGVPICATAVLGCTMVAEHMLLQILALAKRLPETQAIANATGSWSPPRRTDENVFAYNWSKRSGVRGIFRSTIGILGFGEIGVELAKMLRGLRPERVLYHKRLRLPVEVESELGIAYATPEVIYRESDILCCLLPYSPATDQSLNAAVFAQMKQDAMLVHCGSGSVIDESALANAIRNGKIGGAALDTFEWEPLTADNPLVALARTAAFNVLLTPHTAAGTNDFYATHPSDPYENVMRMLAGEPLIDQLD